MQPVMLQVLMTGGAALIAILVGVYGVRAGNRFVDHQLQYREHHIAADQPIVLPDTDKRTGTEG
jgi:hypothetical protein